MIDKVEYCEPKKNITISDVYTKEVLDAALKKSPKPKPNDGSKNSFYDIPSWVEDVDDLCEYLKLSFDEGNILKSLWVNIGDRHSGTNPMREAKKCLHYAERRKKRYEKKTM